MHSFFEIVIKYEKTADNGKVIKVSEKYLVDALSFTEAEARIIKEMEPFISGEFTIASIKKAKVNELVENEGDKWYKAKLNFITFDEEKGVEHKVPSYTYIKAEGIKEARDGVVEHMKGSMADYNIEQLTETKIIDVYKY